MSSGIGELLRVSEFFTRPLDLSHGVRPILPFAEEIRRNGQGSGLFTPKPERPADAPEPTDADSLKDARAAVDLRMRDLMEADHDVA